MFWFVVLRSVGSSRERKRKESRLGRGVKKQRVGEKSLSLTNGVPVSGRKRMKDKRKVQ